MKKRNFAYIALNIVVCVGFLQCSETLVDSSQKESNKDVFNYPLAIGTTWKYYYYYYLRESSVQKRYGIHSWTVVDSTTISDEMIEYGIEAIDLDTLVYAFGTDSIYSLVEDTIHFSIARGQDEIIISPPSRFFNNLEDHIQGFYSSDQTVHLGSPWPESEEGRFYKGGIGLLKMFGAYYGNTREVELLNLLEFNGNPVIFKEK